MTVSETLQTPKLLDGFQSLNTHHCVTGSMRHVYQFNHHPISEEMLLGLGEGVSFIYWHQKGQIPFIGGRGSPKPSMEQIAGQRTGVLITPRTTSSTARADQALFEILATGQPVMLQVDMGFLPYFDFGGSEYHFGGHAIVACGSSVDGAAILVADRDGIYPVPLVDLQRARASAYKPFPPHNRWYSFDFTHKRQPTPQEIYTAIRNQASGMLQPPIRNIGIKGIHKTAEMIPTWPGKMTEDQIRWALFNSYIFISPKGGSGGGAFRYMFSRFLDESGQVTGDNQLVNSAKAFKQIGDRWQELAQWFLWAYESPNPNQHLVDCTGLLQSIADLEASAWSELEKISVSRSS